MSEYTGVGRSSYVKIDPSKQLLFEVLCTVMCVCIQQQDGQDNIIRMEAEHETGYFHMSMGLDSIPLEAEEQLNPHKVQLLKNYISPRMENGHCELSEVDLASCCEPGWAVKFIHIGADDHHAVGTTETFAYNHGKKVWASIDRQTLDSTPKIVNDLQLRYVPG